MKKLLLCLALLIGLADGSVLVLPGFPIMLITPTAIIIEGVEIPIEAVEALQYVPDNAVM